VSSVIAGRSGAIKRILKVKDKLKQHLEENPPPLLMWQRMKYVAVSIFSVLYLNRIYHFAVTPCRTNGLLIKYPQFPDVLKRSALSTP